MYTKSLAALAACLAATTASPIRRQAQPGAKGIAYNDPTVVVDFTPAVSWAYNWASFQGAFLGDPTTIAAGVEFIPMLKPEEVGHWSSDVEAALAAGSQHLLGFNEPDQPESVGGTGLTDIGAAAQLYIDNVTPYSGRAKLGAPAVSAGGIEWLRSFAAACAGNCKIDFVPLHFYDYDHPDAATQFASMQGWLSSTLSDVRNMFGNPNMEIWLTEFGFKPETDQQGSTDFLNLALPWLDDPANGITRYAYFKAENLASGNQLQQSGHTYTGQ